MKHIIIILFFIGSFYNNAFTQDENSFLKNELGANINFFLNDLILSKDQPQNIIDFSTSIESVVTYRRFFKQNKAFQIGVNFYTKRDDEDFVLGIGGNQNQYKKGYFLRFGFQKYHDLSDKIKFYQGLDLLVSYQKYKATIDFMGVPTFFGGDYSTINEEREFGFIPHLGVRFQVNAKFSFSIETNLIVSYSFFDNDTDNEFSFEPIIIGFNNRPNNDAEKFNLKFQQPIVLFFNFRF